MQAMTRIYYFGVAFGLIHLLTVISIFLFVHVNDLTWVWMLFFLIDFPWSLLTIGGLHVMQNLWGDVVWNEHWKHSVYAYWPFFVHGIVGSLWWSMIAIIFGRFLAIKRK